MTALARQADAGARKVRHVAPGQEKPRGVSVRVSTAVR
jgi:hypothetical protein